MGSLGLVELETGEFNKALELFLQSLALLTELGHRRSAGITMGHIAKAHHLMGNFEQALGAFDAALAIHREVGNMRESGTCACAMALCLLDAGRIREAAARWREGLQLLRHYGNAGELKRLDQQMREACAKAGAAPFA